MRRTATIALATSVVCGATMVVLRALYLPMQRRLPQPSRVAVDGVTTLDEAVLACRQTHLQGWDLVAHTQHLAARKFTYSRLNTWDSPSRAFERGMGYCEQQALALKYIYDRLGVACRPAFALRCQFPPRVIDGMPWAGGITGHVWLRVRVGQEERDVCPGSLENRPGVTQFTVLSSAHTLYPWLRPWTYLGSAVENLRRDYAARRLQSAVGTVSLREQVLIQVDPRPAAPA